jgi:hypothetical protein
MAATRRPPGYGTRCQEESTPIDRSIDRVQKLKSKCTQKITEKILKIIDKRP